MPITDVSHNPWLVGASLLVALIAGFTGLSLTQGLSERPMHQRKILIALAAISLGGGIWSMHFVAMLGLQLPVLFYYDAVVTLASALVAILVVGVALLILHFRERTRGSLITAGLIVGIGVLAMHYIGMAGLELCRALYTPLGIVSAIVASCILNVAAFGIAYGERNHRNILLGTGCFGLAVFAVHFIAIFGTRFETVEIANVVGPIIGNEVMAIGVVLTSFVLCAAFLLTGVTFLTPQPAVGAAEVVADAEPEPDLPPTTLAEPGVRQIPYEQEGRTLFIDPASVAAIRAEGHYTHIYTDRGRLFCAWSITEAEKRLGQGVFLKTHRSYLINPAHVSSFERLKDNGVCHFDLPGLSKVPVSRSRLKQVRAALGV
ncbi:MAG: carbon monoxide dehydrogenase [Rhodobacteraceae bacterium]|nr:carbon monoxide dehydrogenase [Paracoccaceae bacterium]